MRALAHITGGGITENLNRALPAACDAEVDLGTWPVPAIAKFVCGAAHLGEDEALKTFNMGLGMVLVVDPVQVEAWRPPLPKPARQRGAWAASWRAPARCATRTKASSTGTRGNVSGVAGAPSVARGARSAQEGAVWPSRLR